jgi:hypothetical protein
MNEAPQEGLQFLKNTIGAEKEIMKSLDKLGITNS